MNVDADVIILGGGCAGLSLAVALAQRAPELQVHVLEPRTEYLRDRTWCFWNTVAHPFEACVTHAWSGWRVRFDGVEARQQSRRYRYEHLPADRFYASALKTVAEKETHRISLQVSVDGVLDHGQYCEVSTSEGRLRARWVFDSRPHPAGGLRPRLEQRFVGWHVRAENPCFDPSVVDLMDFETSGVEGRTTFFYTLPFSSTEALVEATFLDEPSLPLPPAEEMLRKRLERLTGCGGYQVVYREQGALPMGKSRMTRRTEDSRVDRRVVSIGTRGGRVKASSGYAFLRIQRQSAALAEALAGGQLLPTRFERASYGVLDEVFLRALARFPARVPAYFMAMFAHLPPDTLVRFLSETSTPGEMLRVMLALPKLDFLQAALLAQAGSPA